jgi:hypothetical protein
MRAVLLLILIHLALKHLRHVALLGLLSPVLLAPALAHHWNGRRSTKPQLNAADRALRLLCPPAGAAAVAAALAALILATVMAQRLRPIEPTLPAAAAVLAAKGAGAAGPSSTLMTGAATSFSAASLRSSMGAPTFTAMRC